MRPLVLIVDDHDDTRAVYAEHLARSGYDVDEAISGEDAVAKASERVPDAIVMDIMLPEIDGFEATRRIKTADRTRNARVIAITGAPLDTYRLRAKHAGCETLLTKPCLPKKLEEILKTILAS